MDINYVIGDATYPQGKGNKIIAHISNDAGGWGSGFVVAVSRRWAEPEKAYREWAQIGELTLGYSQLINVAADIYVYNMIAQHAFGDIDGPPIRYDALEKCLSSLKWNANALKASVHMPRIGTGLAGGKWEEIEPLIQRTLIAADIPVTVYDLN